jgi:hypothetical protein
MELSALAPLVVVLACSNAGGAAASCTPLAPDMQVAITREIVVCELRAKVSRPNGAAAFAASCARGARMETRKLPPKDRGDPGATVIAAIFY